ncbi:MAG: response regulator [Rubrivivax sp.]|nr:response regulator [Rubrivivax sp.]
MAEHALDFGRFQLRAAQRQLVVDGQPAALGGRAFDLLLALVERRERVVSKGELMDVVWPGLVVEENNLQVQVSALRRLLGPQVIATVQGRGYRFTAEPLAAAVTAPAGPPATVAAPATRDAAEAPSAATAVAPTALPPAAPARAGARHRLLVADDNKVNRLLLCRAIELLGHDVAAVENGRMALDALRRERFDLLLLDLEMPELDGFAVLEQLARDPELHDLPVIVTSSKEGVADVARCIELGADDYLRKPVNAVLLKARVGTSLERRRLREQQKALIRELSAAVPPQEVPAAEVMPPAAHIEGAVLAARVRGAESPPGVAVSAEETLEWLDSAQTLLLEAVVGHGGMVVEAAGDGLVAVFAQARPDAAHPVDARLMAARAALEMVELLEVYDAERRVAGRAGMAVAVGIASGPVLVGQLGAPRRMRRIGLGAPVRLAARLAEQAAAEGRGILVDGATRAGLAGRVAAERAASVRADEPGAGASDLYWVSTG